MRTLFKFLSITLLIILFIFNGKNSYAYVSDDTLKNNNFELEKVSSFDSIIKSIQTSDNMSMISFINKDFTNNYIELNEKYIFRTKDNSLELIELSPQGSKIVTSITFNDMYIRNLNLVNNYIVITGDELNNVTDMNSPFNMFAPRTSIKIFNINDISNIKLTKEFSLSGTLVKLIISDNHINVFSSYKPHIDKTSSFNFLPYYVEYGIKSYFDTNKIYSIPHKETENNYLCAITISLDNTIELLDSKAVWGVSQSIYSDNNFIYLPSSLDDKTRIIKLSIDEELFLKNSSITIPGIITSYEAFNCDNNKIKVITGLKNNNDKTFAIYLLDEDLNIQDAYFMNKSALIESYYFVQDNLFVKYNDRVNSEKSDWLALSFEANSISQKDPSNALTGYTYYSEEYIFVLDVLPDSQLNMRVYDWNYTLIDSVDVLIKDSFKPKELMIYDDNKKLLALPVILDLDQKVECILTFKTNTPGDIGVNLITPDPDDHDTSKSYIDQISEHMILNEDYLYTISPTTITVYDLKNNIMISKNPLD